MKLYKNMLVDELGEDLATERDLEMRTEFAEESEEWARPLILWDEDEDGKRDEAFWNAWDAR